MKKYLSFIFALVLTAALFTGCGCTGKDAMYTTAPTTMPTIMTTTPTTAATQPTTESTRPTVDRGNGPAVDPTLDTTDNTDGTESTNTAEGNARRMDPTIR